MLLDEASEQFELVPLAGGIHSLRSRANGQTFHPVVGPQKEAETVHVAGTRLVERANAQAATGFVVWDVGLGAAANALAAVVALGAGYRRPETVSLCSFDRNLGALEFALANAAALGYPVPYEPVLRRLLEQREVRLALGTAELVWEVSLGDFPTKLANETRAPYVTAPNAIFYDPYSPTVNHEMWTLETFRALHARTRPDTPCLLTTYTRSTAVRVTLLLAGWFVGIGGATGEKDETTVATNDPALLERPLSRRWLEKKVYASTNAAPLRNGSEGTRRPVSEEDFGRLREHPQMTAGD